MGIGKTARRALFASSVGLAAALPGCGEEHRETRERVINALGSEFDGVWTRVIRTLENETITIQISLKDGIRFTRLILDPTGGSIIENGLFSVLGEVMTVYLGHAKCGPSEAVSLTQNGSASLYAPALGETLGLFDSVYTVELKDKDTLLINGKEYERSIQIEPTNKCFSSLGQGFEI